MKYAVLIARALLALIFVVFSLNFWLHFIPMSSASMPSPDSPAGKFFAAVFTTGYMAAVKVVELLGGLMVASGRFLNIGLLFLGPVILNILFFDAFLAHAFNPVSTLAAVLALFLLWANRQKFAALVPAV